MGKMNVSARRVRPSRSAGTVFPLDLVKNRLRGPSNAATSADIEAVDRGEARTVACMFRGTYGPYPRRFRQQMLDLMPDGPIVRPFWYAIRRSKFRIEDPILSASVRPRNPRTDWKVRATGMYASGSPLEWAGFVVIQCQTSPGVLEFAVPRPDVPLLLHYLKGIMHVI
jgi:hypothetical protein